LIVAALINAIAPNASLQTLQAAIATIQRPLREPPGKRAYPNPISVS
jgi:hypothetical protein